jgi:hypothetical protein
MTEEIKNRQTTEEANGAIPPGQPASTGGARHGAEKEINVYLYENLVSNLDCQIRAWIRKAERESDYEMAQQFRWKAEGLGYALRLLYVFKPDFDEITEEFGILKCRRCGRVLDLDDCPQYAESTLCDACGATGSSEEHPIAEDNAGL